MFTRRQAIVSGTKAVVGASLLRVARPCLRAAAGPSGPGARAGHAMAYHAGASAVCLLGGDHEDLDRHDPREQVWLWNGYAWRSPATREAPPAASLVAAAADPQRKSVLIFGGFTVVGPRKYGPPAGDLWELDADCQWRLQALEGPRPGSRHHHAMAFDARRGRLVLYGGFNADNAWMTDVWEWDRQRWHRLEPATGPGERAHHAMAYDTTRGRIVLRGGTTSTKVQPTDTWEWDGTAWHRTATDGPGPGGGYRMAYDQARRATVLCGGDTSLWDGTKWTRITTAPAPVPRMVHAMAYDVARERVVLHGGAIDRVNTADTWEWDGTAWTDVSASRSR